MARGSRNRTNKGNHQGARSSATHKQQGVQSSNLFASLASGPEQFDGEVNAHLTERFGRGPAASHHLVPHDDIPSAGPARVNNDIREYLELTEKPVTAGAWIDKPEVPSPAEILRPTKRPHKADGAYDSTEEYLGTTYDLLREDAIRPLRDAVEEVRKDPYKDEAEYDNNSIGIYEPVYITSLVFSPRGLAMRVAFSLSRVKKHIRWEQSKRLITGSLVALSPADDAFQTTCVLAVVAARPLSALEQNPPEIDLFFARPEDQEIDPMKKWVMIECRASFFEASRHTLLALQHMMREPFPLSEHLVQVQKEVKPPAYIQHNPYINLSSLVSMEESTNFENVHVLDEWPAPNSLSLDRSQSKALHRMLTSRVAIVQGPPGTGKTHVSVVMMKVLRDNLRKDDSPIIITAQTNHAVDQILRHTREFETNFIRLGGRSKDADIKKRTLFEVRSETPPQKQPGSQKTQAMNAIRKLTTRFEMLLAPLEANKPPLPHGVLLSLGLLTQEQADSLELDSQHTMGMSSAENPGILMEQWLGKCLAPCHRPSQPDDFGWGFEEEDFEVEQIKELEAEAVAQDDDDIEALRGPVTLLNDNYVGKGGSLLTTAEIKELLRKTSDLTMIAPMDRGAIYNYFKREVKVMIVAEVRNLAKEYNKAVLQRKVGMWEEDVRLLSQQRIIGCTTTGLSKYRALISALRPRIILVEEAAETMEAPVTAACLPTLEHLILIGDHQQLRPHTQVHAFEDEPYYLNLSLFERLVRNDVAYSTLTRQRRMIPEIRRLLYPIYEKTLKDHDSVTDLANRPPVEGMGGNNSFYFCHEWPEARDGNMSCYNEYEASMIVGFVDYLVLNGVDPLKITLLTFYNGQRKALMRLKGRHQNSQAMSRVKVVTVDGYQGEENDIVILSLVRSNRKHEIGFLSSENRACVALSRAKRGFYIFGNAELLACESRVWACVVDIMYRHSKVKVTTGQERRVGYNLPLECDNHHRKVWIQEPDDWQHIHGGCDRACDGVLPCHHKCPYRCHPFEHDRVNCMMPCNRRLNCGHICTAICSDACKCQICGNRGNGVKSMLKIVPNGSPDRQPRGAPRNLFLNTAFQTPSNPVPISKTPDNSGVAAETWRSFVNGGVAEDDARVRWKMKEEEAKYLEAIRKTPQSESTSPSKASKLIQVSPEKRPAASANVDLLIDLDIGAQTPSWTTAVSRKGKGREKGKGKVSMNLLD
ncbi:P-loop containing nucleoside triphosphate hydrolase protein [Paraphoma chrysanthemicola]|uniref:P-loop containing nucleoside triphosphate hydrolase protein n=1 Tax=Paraphoma chrysanthemicola TaxID=798071 RepID=A0A8K0W2M2_9PLEO|nr:P-loop containing nucleoside triphosphate hydrolase protein [Paraphoma chrysanthemicola]